VIYPDPPKVSANRKRWIVIAVVGAALVALFKYGIFLLQRDEERREVVTQLNITARQESLEAALGLKTSDAADGSIGRLKDQFGQAASQLPGSDAALARAMIHFLESLQAPVRAYGAASKRLVDEKVLAFDFRDRAAIETKREVVRDFLASNARLADAMQHYEDSVRLALDAEKVPPSIRDSLVAESRRVMDTKRPLVVKIRACDQTGGENILAALNLLDHYWGAWSRDEATGRLRFRDSAALQAFNSYMGKIQTARVEGEKAQQELGGISLEQSLQEVMHAFQPH
jgi:hypothetical protein